MSAHRCGGGGRVQTLTTGVLFLLAGCAVWAGARGWFSWRDAWTWWPLWLAIPGVYKLAAAPAERNVPVALAWFALAGTLVAANRGYLELRLRDLGPLVLVLIGLRLLYRSSRQGRSRA